MDSMGMWLGLFHPEKKVEFLLGPTYKLVWYLEDHPI